MLIRYLVCLPELTMIFCSFSLKYPLGFHQLFVLVGHCGMRKKDRSPIVTLQCLETLILITGIILTGKCPPIIVSNVELAPEERDSLNEEQPSPTLIAKNTSHGYETDSCKPDTNIDCMDD